MSGFKIPLPDILTPKDVFNEVLEEAAIKPKIKRYAEEIVDDYWKNNQCQVLLVLLLKVGTKKNLEKECEEYSDFLLEKIIAYAKGKKKMNGNQIKKMLDYFTQILTDLNELIEHREADVFCAKYATVSSTCKEEETIYGLTVEFLKKGNLKIMPKLLKDLQQKFHILSLQNP